MLQVTFFHPLVVIFAEAIERDEVFLILDLKYLAHT